MSARSGRACIAFSVGVLASLPVAASAQEPGPDQPGFVYETGVDRWGDGVLRLGNGAAVELIAAPGAVQEGDVAILLLLPSGCETWIERSGLHRCTLLQAPPRSARPTPARLVQVERIADAGATLAIGGGAEYGVTRQRGFTRSWRPGDAVLLEDARLLHLAYGDQLVEVAPLR